MSLTRTALAFVLALALAAPSAAEAPKKLFLVGGPPDGHPPQTHEYMAGLKILAKCLGPVKGLDLSVVRAEGAWPEGPELLGRADGVVLFLSEGARWLQHDPKRREALAAVAKRGGGLSVLHWGMGTKDAAPVEPFVALFGGCHGGPDRKFKVTEEIEAAPADARHPILAGVGRFKARDEFYYRLKFVKPEGTVKPLLRVPIDGRDEVVAWAWERPDGGRSFGFSGLHFHDNWKRPAYRRLVAQGVAWSMKRPVPEGGLAVDVAENDLK